MRKTSLKIRTNSILLLLLNKQVQIIGLIFFLFLLFIHTYLLKIVPVWPDESIYADIVNNLINENRLGSDLWANAIPGMTKYAYWNPSLFFYEIAGWTQIFGKSIEAQRSLSVIAGLVFLGLFYIFSKLLGNFNRYSYNILCLVMIIINYNFLQASVVSRPEIFVLCFGIISYICFIGGYFYKNRWGYFFLSGLFSSFAILNHFIAIFIPLSIIFFWLIEKKQKILRDINVYLYLLALLSPLLLWLISIFPNITYLKEQFILGFTRKGIDSPIILLFLFKGTLEFSILYLIYFLTSFIFLFYSIKYKLKKLKFLSIIIVFLLIFVIKGNMEWYFVYPIPFIILALVILKQKVKNIMMKRLVFILIFLEIITCIHIQFVNISEFKSDSYLYKEYVDNILSIIPDNKTVFLSAIPDPYFGFKSHKRNNKIYMMNAFKIAKKDYLSILNDSDYVIYTALYEQPVLGNTLLNYLALNTKEKHYINKPSQYKALIFELVSKNERKFN